MICIACTSFAKFWLKDGDYVKAVCTLHMIKYKNEGYEILKPLTKDERQNHNGST